MKGHPRIERAVRGGVRPCGIVAAVMAVLAMAMAGPGSTAASARTGGGTGGARPALQIFYRSPVLVRPGDRVRIPVDVVCTRGGRPCASHVRLTVLGPLGQAASAAADPALQFDLTGPAGRARTGGRLDFVLSATADAGGRASLPVAGAGALHVYVAPDMARAALPIRSFGSFQRGRPVVFLPWGSGGSDAGLSAGEEALTLGPSSFAVGPHATIEVADVFHQRILEFRGGRRVRTVRLAMTPETDIAIGRDGRTFVASDIAGAVRRTRFTTIASDGSVSSVRTVPGGILAQVGTDGASGFAHVLPLDAWIPFPGGGAAVESGLPLGAGHVFLRSMVGRTVRLGVADGDRVLNAVELRSGATLGDLAFAAPDGSGGYVAVVRVVTAAGDQYEVAHVAGGRHSVSAFAVPSHQFAQTMPQSQFRLGPDGHLYQMTTSPDGVRILRYSMGGNR
jgi:hypothetical protein